MPFVWTTQEVAAPEQFSYWRDAISDAFVPLEPEGRFARGFCGRIDSLGLETLRASTIAADSHHVRLSHAGVARQRGNPFFVNLLRRGHVEVMQNGESQHAGPGDIYIVDSSVPWSVAFLSQFEMFCIEIDESMLRHRLGSRGRMAAPVLSGKSGGGRLLARYMALVGDLSEDDASDSQPLIVEHCAALLARANAGTQATSPTLRDQQAMLRGLLAFIDAHLTDPALSPERVCQALRISRSYLFKLLLNAGHTFEGYVRRARLNGCRAALLRHPEMPVAQIAANWGFADTSSFNRSYRREFGQTPSQSRLAAACPDTPPSLS